MRPIVINAYSALELTMNAPEKVSERAAVCTPTLVHFAPSNGLIQFRTNCSGSGNTWVQTVTFNDWWSVVTLDNPENIETPEYLETLENTEPPPLDDAGQVIQPQAQLQEPDNYRLVKPTATWEEVRDMYPELINMDIQVFCNCPAFQYWGSRYHLEQTDSAIFNEGTPKPDIRNPEPEQPNIICKHLAAVFANFF